DVGVGKMRVLASPLKLPSMVGYDLEVTAYQSMADAPDVTSSASTATH
ncbi:MAG: bifunctional 3,4-dihydroxy-2-butanone-4-phosphate synthase/GTP cyclohydrolase II, partial [Actinobacteria bacterium]|nr:bifunctional 3,4-dihydroxy-2-butanone-4-phosphate synthase/GTP cyclohydrolase II [Actinomycetota bacterium]